MKYLLKWTNDRPEEAADKRFASRPDAEKYVLSLLPQAEFLVLAPKPDQLPGEVVYVWNGLDALEAGKPHSAVIAPFALGNTLQIDAAFVGFKQK